MSEIRDDIVRFLFVFLLFFLFFFFRSFVRLCVREERGNEKNGTEE